MVDEEWRELLWGQLGGAIDMLENAILACPDQVWRAGEPRAGTLVLDYFTSLRGPVTHGVRPLCGTEAKDIAIPLLVRQW